MGDSDEKLWKKKEIEEHVNNLRLQAIGDDFVMAIRDLAEDFESKFKNIVPIGPISNYHSANLHTIAAVATTGTPADAEKSKAKGPVIKDNLQGSPPKNGNAIT